MAQRGLSLLPPDGTQARAAEPVGPVAVPPLGSTGTNQNGANSDTGTSSNGASDTIVASLTDANEQQQIQAEIEAIAHAIETLRKAEPALEQWTGAPPAALPPRQVWVLIGAVWLSTAMITLGAAMVASSLAG